jgi:hypothetical protein
MESINKLIKIYDELTKKYGHHKSFNGLKRHYSDVCSEGDGIINDLIDGLNSNDNNYYQNLLTTYKTKLEFVERLVNDYLIDTIESFIDEGLNPDPYHVETEIIEGSHRSLSC